MRGKILTLLLSAPLLTGCIITGHPLPPTPAQVVAPVKAPVPASQPGQIMWQKEVPSGGTVIFDQDYYLNADCSPIGEVHAKALQIPLHGVLTLENRPVHTNYSLGNPRYVCNAEPVIGLVTTYTAYANFHGQDGALVEYFLADGRYRIVNYDIRVH